MGSQLTGPGDAGRYPTEESLRCLLKIFDNHALCAPYQPPSDHADESRSTSPSPPVARLIGGYKSEFLFSALIAGFGAFCNYLTEPFPTGFFAIIAVMAALTSLCVMFTIAGPRLTAGTRIAKAIVPGFFAFIGLSALISIGVPIIRGIGESYFGFNLASDGFVDNLVVIFVLFYPAVVLVMLAIAGAQLARYNDEPNTRG